MTAPVFPDISEPHDPRVAACLAWSCDVCAAKRGVLCTNTIRPDQVLPGRVVHHARLVDRRREPKGENE